MARPFTIGSAEALITVSIGIPEMPRHGETADHLLRAAGAALRKAKEKGGHQQQLSSPDRQAGFLQAAGCDEAQGYWFARPMNAEKLGEYLRAADRERKRGVSPG